jgi:5-methylcytosine-specific restriction endonuclease McrA
MAVFVLDRKQAPLMPCSEKRARKLLAAGRARVHRLLPFAIRLLDRTVAACAFQPLKIKLDPGSKTMGIAIVRESETFGRAKQLVRFDMQQMDKPEIAGVEYRQGTLAGYEVREYLLEKWGRKCAYCDAQNVPLNIDHVHARARGGSNRISNLVLACVQCNIKKGAHDVQAFLSREPARLARIEMQMLRPLKDAAAVNATRWALWQALKATGLPVATGSGGRRELIDQRCGMLTYALQDIDQVVVWIDVVQAAGHEQALDDADMLGAHFGPTEHSIFATERYDPQRTFQMVRVDPDIGVVQVGALFQEWLQAHFRRAAIADD